MRPTRAAASRRFALPSRYSDSRMSFRRALAALVISAWPFAATAQQAPASLPPIGLPLPPIGLPLAPIGLPLPSMGIPAAESVRPGLRDAMREHRAGEGRETRRAHPHTGPAVIYVVPGWYGMSYTAMPGTHAAVDAPPPPAPAAPPPVDPSPGVLRLELQPERQVQLFVDGYYVGLLEDFPTGLALEPGAHRLDLRAEGHAPLALDVKIAAGRSIRYRGALTPDPDRHAVPPREAAPAPAAAVPPSTFYLIPGCYLGNVHPKEVTLPPGCELSRLISRVP